MILHVLQPHKQGKHNGASTESTTDSSGVYGKTAGYYGTVEQQGLLTLHLLGCNMGHTAGFFSHTAPVTTP